MSTLTTSHRGGRVGECQVRRKFGADTDSLSEFTLRFMLLTPREPRKPTTHRTFFFSTVLQLGKAPVVVEQLPRVAWPPWRTKKEGWGCWGCFLRLASNHLNAKEKLGCYVHSKFPQLEMLQQICLMLMESTLYTYS